jgi:hypothetical protein
MDKQNCATPLRITILYSAGFEATHTVTLIIVKGFRNCRIICRLLIRVVGHNNFHNGLHWPYEFDQPRLKEKT